MNPNDKAVIHGSDSPDWRTPPDLFVALDNQFHFTADVCASPENRYCERWWGPEHPEPMFRDSQKITVPWATPGAGEAVFINPPFSRDLLRKTKNAAWDIAAWALVASAQAHSHRITVVGVFPHSLQTEWWYSYVRHGVGKADEIREIPHRVSFLRPDGSKADNAGGNTAIVIWRPDCGYVGDWAPTQRVWDYL